MGDCHYLECGEGDVLGWRRWEAGYLEVAGEGSVEVGGAHA